MQFDITLLQFHILRNGSMQQLQQIVFLQRLQRIELTTREQRTNHLERWVLCCCTNKRHRSLLYRTQERVLLRL